MGSGGGAPSGVQGWNPCAVRLPVLMLMIVLVVVLVLRVGEGVDQL